MDKNKIIVSGVIVVVVLLMSVAWYGVYQYFFNREDNAIKSTVAEVEQRFVGEKDTEITDTQASSNTQVATQPTKTTKKTDTFGITSEKNIQKYYDEYAKSRAEENKSVDSTKPKPRVAGVSTSKDLKVYVQEQYAGKKLAINSYSFTSPSELDAILNRIKSGDVVYLKFGGKVYKVTPENKEEIKALIR